MSTETRKTKITANSHKTVLPDDVSELVIADTTLTGFRLRIRPHSRRYVYSGRVSGAGRRTVTLGDATSMTASEARQAAQATRNQFLRGVDVVPPEPAQMAVTFEAAHDTRHALWSVGKLRQQKKAPSPMSVAGARSDIQRALSHMGTLPVRDVDLDVARAFVVELENEDVGQDMKRRAMGEASRVLDYATARGWAAGNPFKMLTNFASAPARERVLTRDEIKQLWKAAGEMGRASAFLSLLIAQPLRLSCAANLKWRDVDLESRVITLPADQIGNKAKITFHLAMTDTAHGILDALPRRNADDYVFAGRTDDSRIWWDQARADQFAKLHGIENFRLHDLRTAFASILADQFADADVDAIDLMLAHKRKGVQAKYQRSFRLDAQQRVARLWDSVLGDDGTDNVVVLDQRTTTR
jgi:integrase